MPVIQVKNLVKEFKVYKRKKGYLQTLKSIFSREYEIKRAVNNINFEIHKGELVGYIGSNGAGKSTTIKMLCGILTPTSGSVLVNDCTPSENRKENALRIGVVFGQRSQLYWDLPMEETFELYKKMYRIDDKTYKRNLEYFVELLEMQEFLGRPVRQLSLGQKMKANLSIAFLHNPEIVYLDEPTIGLDVLVKSKIRQFIREVNKEHKTTVILTTHDMDDIEQICNRLLMINKGEMLYDGDLKHFKDVYSSDSSLIVDFADETPVSIDPRLKLIKNNGVRKQFSFHRNDLSVGEAITLITRNHQIKDVKILESNIEDIIKKIYSEDRT